MIQNTCLLVIWDLLNMGKFDHINRMITLSGITLPEVSTAIKKNGSNDGFYGVAQNLEKKKLRNLVKECSFAFW